MERLGNDPFELYFTRKTATRIDSKDQKIESLSRSEDVGLAIRVLKEGRLGFSFTTSMDDDAIDRAARSAVDVAALMPPDEHNGLFSFSSFHYPAVDHYDEKGVAESIEKKTELARQLERECLNADARVKGVRTASVGETLYEVHMVDSHGEYIQHRSTFYTASVMCRAELAGESQTGHDFNFSSELAGLEIKETGRLAAVRATELLGAGAAPTMKCPAILRSDVVADFLGVLSSCFSAEEIDKGRSMLAGKLGDRVFSEGFTLIDDGLMAGGLATSPFDGEGVPSTKTTLVDGGFFTNILCDGYYSRKEGRAPTGSATRGIKAPPEIGTSNFYLVPGRKKPAQLLDGVSRGILITDVMGVHTANSVTGDFSLGASGILIENGRLTRPVRGLAIAGNVLELFRRMTDLGDDLRFFGAVGAPSIRVSEISVGGA